ncbi:JAB domain-containing protein [uncultured Brevundimonas sp.]|uniref:JAB domain-containing protein n=1 Tax=uncultured Brevundimonas sp. TaxID=213418 RepID=UPI0030EB1E12|tara:strand:- start:124 stop:654 length:531 start_codon:yes stop_codon:yes gene_type:complete
MRPIPTRALGPCPNERLPAGPTLVHAVLDDQALLSLMLRRTGNGPGADTDRLAGILLERFAGLGAVVAAEPGELRRTPGLDPLALSDIKLLRELAVRLAREDSCRRPVITSWTALLTYVRAALAQEPREQFRTLFLDRRNILMRDELVAHGTVDHAPVYSAGPARVATLGRVPDIA